VVYWPERPSGPDGGVASLKEVARNRLGEGIWASPVFAGRRLYLRGFEHLYCIEADDGDLAEAEELADPSPEVEDSTLELDP